MADLLECVIQIKALADTPRRLALRLREASARRPFDAGPVLRALLRYEAWLHEAIEAGVVAEDAEVRAEPSVHGAGPHGQSESSDALLARFGSLRADNVRRLDSLGASTLGRTILVAGRGPTTIADLVALALAHDTDSLARIVRSALVTGS